MALTISENNGNAVASYGTVKETFPVSVAGATLIAVKGFDVNGTTSTFTTDFAEGDFIWISDTDELRRIDNIVSDTKMTLSQSATTDASTAYRIIKNKGFKTINYKVDDVATAKINGSVFPKNSEGTFSTNNVFFPILIDTVATANIVAILASN